MKPAQKKKNNQKKIIQQKIDLFSKLNEPIPPSGWVKAIRGALGLSIRQLADRVGVTAGAIDQLEKREQKRRVTIESLDSAAQAMDCKVVYAIVPQKSGSTLDDIIENQAMIVAAQVLRDVAHTMRIEAQGTSENQVKDEIRRIAEELISTGNSRIWDFEIKKKNGKKSI